MATSQATTTVSKTSKGYVPSKQFQAPTNPQDNTPLEGRHIMLSTGTGENRYHHVLLKVIYAGMTLAFTKAQVEDLTATQIADDSATVNVERKLDMEIMDIEVGANGKGDIEAATAATLSTDGLSYNITVSNFSDEITLGQDLQLKIYWGYPN